MGLSMCAQNVTTFHKNVEEAREEEGEEEEEDGMHSKREPTHRGVVGKTEFSIKTILEWGVGVKSEI